jgi:predicted nucleic acid-binding Zn ribbon protein
MGREKRPMSELSQVLADVLKQAGLAHLPHEDKLRRNWEALLGPKAAHIASLDSLRGYVLKVRVESAVWRQELAFQREAIRRRANELLGADLVREVVLV